MIFAGNIEKPKISSLKLDLRGIYYLPRIIKAAKFGDAAISNKHSNFFINKGNASFKDMKKLIEFVKNNVKNKTGVNLDLEIILVE